MKSYELILIITGFFTLFLWIEIRRNVEAIKRLKTDLSINKQIIELNERMIAIWEFLQKHVVEK